MPEIVLPANFTPRPYQRPIMRHFDHGGTRAWWCVHRRGGKDRTMLAQVSKMAHKRVGTYWHLLPTLRQARKVVWDNITGDGLRLIDATFPPSIVAKKNETEMKIELKNGSIIQLVGADNFDANVGANPVHVTFSEFALTHPRAWHLIRPILTENNGTAAFISTPRGYNQFHEIGEIAKRDTTGRWYAATMDIRVTGMLSDEDVALEIREGMPEELARQEYYCDFSAANVGSILGKQIEQAEREGRISDDVYAVDGGIELSCDIGYRDTAAWWAWQRLPNGWYAVVGYVEGNGLDADDWIERLRACGWGVDTVKAIWMPHDARAKTFTTKVSAVERFRAAGYDARIVPQTTVSHRINAARVVTRQTFFNRTACEIGLRALRDWQFRYDEERRTYSSEPDHNWASHGGDAFSYGALVMFPRRIEPEKSKPQQVFAKPADRSFTLEDLWESAPTRSKRV